MNRLFNDLKKYYKYVIYAGKAELKADIARSHMSWLWWILDPLLFMLVYTFVSLIVFGKAEQYFSAFIFIGYTSYKFFEKILKTSVGLVAANKAIVKKIYIPKFVLLLVKVYVTGFKSMISFLLVFVAMMLYRVPITWHVIEFLPLLALLIFVTFAFSTILMHFGVFVEDLSNVINIGLKLLFYMSGVFYSFDSRITDEWLQFILLKCNPIAFIIEQMRNVLLYGTGIDWITYAIWMVIAVSLSFGGIAMIYKNENGYVKVI